MYYRQFEQRWRKFFESGWASPGKSRWSVVISKTKTKESMHALYYRQFEDSELQTCGAYEYCHLLAYVTQSMCTERKWYCTGLCDMAAGQKLIFFFGGYFHIPLTKSATLNRLLHCSLWQFSGALYFWGLFFAFRGRNRPEPRCNFFPCMADRVCYCGCHCEMYC